MKFSIPNQTAMLALVSILWSSHGQAQAVGEEPSHKIEQARPWLGVAIEEGSTGVSVKNVIQGTPAAESGLQAGDEILSISGHKVSKPPELIEVIRNQGVGTTVKVEFIRKKKSMSKDIKLVARPDELEMLRKEITGKPVPKLPLEELSGKISKGLGSYKGKTVLVEFWSTWCPACRASHERLSAYANEMKDKGIVVLAISSEEMKLLVDYAEKTKPNFTILRDGTEKLHSELKVSAIPMLLVIDKRGIMRFATIGAGSSLEEAIEKTSALAKEAGTNK